MEATLEELGGYNLLFRNMPKLFQGQAAPVQRGIFRAIWEEYLTRLRSQKSLTFPFSASNFQSDYGTLHDRVLNNLSLFNEVGLIKYEPTDGCSAGLCTVNADYILSLLRTFRTLKKPERKSFKDAIWCKDQETLKKCGYVLIPGYYKVLINMSGRVQVDEPVSPDTTLQQVIPTSNRCCGLASSDTTLLRKCRENIINNFSIDDIIDLLKQQPSITCCDPVLPDTTQQLFNTEFPITPEIADLIGAISIILLGRTRITCCGQPVSPDTTPRITCCDSKRKEKNNKENEWMPSASYIEGENDLKEEIDENLPGEEFKRVDMAGYSQVKHKNSLPYYSTSQVREITANPEEAVTSSDKLFIYLMWEILSDQTYKVEDGEESDDKVEGSQFPVQDFKSTILRTAYGSMCDAIEDGMFETKSGQEFPVDKNLEPITWEQALLIPGFETISTEQEDYYIITSAKIHNIFGEPVEPVKGKQHRRRSEEERERENEYFHQLILCRNDDDKYQELTNAEAAVIIFMDEHFQVDYEKGEVTGLKKEFVKIDGNYVNSMELTRYINIVQNEVDRAFTLVDFLSLLTNGKPGLDGSLNISERMFSYDNIQFWNQKHGEISPIKL